MIHIILAAGLSTNVILIALLFRRLRRLSWQLRDIRAERNSEWILHALQDVPEQGTAVAQAAGGTYDPITDPQPVRRKRHLGLYIGGLSGIAATATEATRHAWREHRGQLVVGAAATALVAATAVTLIVVERQSDPETRPPTSAPEVTATVTRAASSAPSNAALPRVTGEPGSVSPTAQPPVGELRTSVEDASGAPIGSEPSPAPSGTSPTGGSSESGPTGDGAPPPSSSASAPPASSDPPAPSDPPALCLGLALLPVLDLTACLSGGG